MLIVHKCLPTTPPCVQKKSRISPMLSGKQAAQYPAAQDTKIQLGSPSKKPAHCTSDNKLFIRFAMKFSI